MFSDFQKFGQSKDSKVTSQCVVKKNRVHLHLTADRESALLPPFHGPFEKSRGVAWIQRRQAVMSRRPHTSDLLFSDFCGASPHLHVAGVCFT